MNQYTKRALLYALLLTVCAALLGSCIHPIPGDFRTTPVDETTIPSPETTISTTPEETTPEETTPEPTTPQETTTEEPVTETTPSVTTPVETTTEQVITTQPPEPPKPPVEKIKIYIDQGHNPFSPTHPPSWNTGASNESLGLYEQDITYKIGILLSELLAEDERFEVRLSRPTAETILGTDNDSALDYRVNDAAVWGADYFISLHTNSYTDSSAKGLEVYTATGDTKGYALGEEVLGGLLESTELRNRGMKNGDHLRVLKNAKMPAILVEMGFISNDDEAKLLDESPELFARGIYDGIQTYFDALEEEPTPAETTAEQ